MPIDGYLLLFIVGSLLLFLFFAPYARALIYDYRVSDVGVHIVLLHRWPIYTVPYEEIVSYRYLRMLEALTLWAMPNQAFYVVNRLFSSYVGLVRQGKPMLVITPLDAQTFVKLAEQMSKAGRRDVRGSVPPAPRPL